MYLIGPGNKAPGKKRQNEKLSCSKMLTVPSMDCTQRKSRPVQGEKRKLIVNYIRTWDKNLRNFTKHKCVHMQEWGWKESKIQHLPLTPPNGPKQKLNAVLFKLCSNDILSWKCLPCSTAPEVTEIKINLLISIN